MARQPSTDRNGNPFSESLKDQVWAKAKNGKDICGRQIIKEHYGRTDVVTGWEIDHIKPVAKGGGDEISNLQPLQWKTNRLKSDSLMGEIEYCKLE